MDNIKKSKEQEFKELLEILPDFCVTFFKATRDRYQITTKVAYALDLKVFFQYLITAKHSKFPYESIKFITLEEIAALNAVDIQDYLEYLEYYEIDGKIFTNKNQGKKRKLMSLKALYKYFGSIGKIDRSPTEFVYSPTIHKKEIKTLSENEKNCIKKELETGQRKQGKERAYHDKTKYRNIAIYQVFIATGIRVSELVNINDEDVDYREQYIKVLRKGGKEDIIYFNDETLRALLDYIDFERNQLMKEYKPTTKGQTPLFFSRKGKRISVGMVELIIKKNAEVLTVGKTTPHKLRKTFGSELYDETKDIYIVKEALGHGSISTSEEYYVQFNEKELEKAMKNKQ